MHPADIKAAIEKAGSSQRDIADECDVSPSAVAHVIHGRGTSTKVAQAVARITGLAVSALWPGKYDSVASPAPALVTRRRSAQALATAVRKAA
jgi:lambda repressor-like predicted transcriptional regulator